MDGATIAWIVVGIVILAILIALVIWIMNRLYRRSSKEISFVRTGLGGQKVVMNGGAFVLPIVHEVIPVNMNTLRLEVRRGREGALITEDRMRVDIVAEFYVRVQSSPEAIANAAQTLGQRTMQPEALGELVEGKFVDALRSVAAEMSMEQMHVKRGEYVRRVRQTVAEDLLKNGLELETVSLTSLDQTNMEFFNPSNAFDAEGLTRLTEEIERRKKIRNDIEQDTLIQIRNKNLETERMALDIDRDLEYARLSQERELEVRRAHQRADLARERADKEQEAERAQLAAREAIERARIGTERVLEEERISRERDVQAAEIERRRTVELAEQHRAIAIAEQSKAQSEAQAAADKARALAVTEEERVFTARETEMAERRKLIDADKPKPSVEAGTPPTKSGALFGADNTRERHGTSHVSIVDAEGNAVSFTTSIEGVFGAHRMVQGFFLNNQLTDFAFKPADKDGLPVANRVEAGKRPRSSMAPTIVLGPDGKLFLVTGSPGGSRIILYVVKSIVCVIDWTCSAGEAAELVNFGSRNGPLEVESGFSGARLGMAMWIRGHKISPQLMTSGVHLIIARDGHYEGAADPRREGTVRGE